MSRIRSKDTKPELVVRRYLHGRGLRFRLHAKGLPGRPDIVLRRFRTVVLVHGCFWHGHRDCPHFSLPKTRPDFWRAKIKANRSRDTLNCFRLATLGWRVLTVWECELAPKARRDTLDSLHNRLIDQAGVPAKAKGRRKEVIRRTIKFVPGTDAEARKQRISQLLRRLEWPLSEILLLRKGLPSLPYSESGILLADSARLYFAASAGECLGEGYILCTRCGKLLEDCVWEAQDGFCTLCWGQAA
jgi:DNA mismatch endonuclease (patch repair protein)